MTMKWQKCQNFEWSDFNNKLYLVLVLLQSFQKMVLTDYGGQDEFGVSLWPGIKGNDWSMNEENQVMDP